MSNDPGREDIEKVRAILEGKDRLAFIAEALESKAGREFLRGYMEYLAVNTLAFQYDTFPGACAVFAPAISGNDGEVKRLVMICVTEPSMVEDVLRAVQPVLDGGIAVDMTDGTTSDFASVVESIVGRKEEEGTDSDTDTEEDGEWL